jgi:hypothetical protein
VSNTSWIRFNICGTRAVGFDLAPNLPLQNTYQPEDPRLKHCQKYFTALFSGDKNNDETDEGKGFIFTHWRLLSSF